MAATAERVRSTKITIALPDVEALIRGAAQAPETARVEFRGGIDAVYFSFALIEWDDACEPVDLRHIDVTPPDDLRPKGWTEALALSFISERCDRDREIGAFAIAFNEGDWPQIQRDWPEFTEFVAQRSR